MDVSTVDTSLITPLSNTYCSGLEFLSIVDVVHADFSIGQEAVALDLSGEKEISQHLVVCTGQELVEDVVASFSRLLVDYTRLLQQICTGKDMVHAVE